MLILFFIISLSVFIIFLCIRLCFKKYNNTVTVIKTTSLIFTISFFALVFLFGYFYSGKITINEKIVLYEKQNKVIVEQLEACVKSYTDYEGENFKKIANKKSGTNFDFLFSYPEMKANKLYTRLANKLIKNNNVIIDLKRERISYKRTGFWLCFNLF
jgi:hypothetical protein